MWYSVIDLKEFNCRIVKDKKEVSGIVGMSIPTLDKKLNGNGVLLHKQYIIGRSEPMKSGRGSNQ